MARITKIAITAVVVIIAVIILTPATRPDPIEMLIEREVPVPAGATATDSEHGGSFAQYLFVRVELDAEGLQRYRERLPEGVPLNSASGIKVVTNDTPDTQLMELFEQETETRRKHVVNGGYLPWWDIDLIDNGTWHQQDLDNACRYEVFIDDDKSVVYICWRYS